MLMLALVISAAIHMRIGLKEIIEDYVHGGAKVVAILLATFFAAGVGLAASSPSSRSVSDPRFMAQDATPPDARPTTPSR